MFRNSLSTGFAERRSSATAMLAVAMLIAAPAISRAQGPPSGLPGSGPVVLEGELEVSYEDHDDEGRLVYFLHSDNRRVPLRLTNGTMPDLPTGARVRISGNLADGTVTTSTVTTLGVSTTRTLGPQSALVILFNFANNTAQPFSSSTVSSVNDSVKNFYLENSYGQTVMSFAVTGWLTITATDAGCDYYTWATQAEAAAAAAGFNYLAYDRRIFAFPRASSCGWSGMGNVAGPRSWVNGSYALRTVAHEQGHNFGNHHSHSLRCDLSSCVTVDYGDDRDVLGASGVVGHLNAFQKERLGFLNYGSSPAIQTVSSSGDYWIENYELNRGSGPKALKIWNAVDSTYYYIESRARTGFDANVPAGVTLHVGSPTLGSVNHQVDLAPTTTTYVSTLDVGQTFSDAGIGASVQTLSSTLDGAMVRVAFGALASCTRAAPTVSLSPASQTGATGVASAFSVSVRNNNTSSCAPAAFSLAANVPSGWLATTSGSSLASVASGSTAAVTLSVTPAAGSAGTVAFAVNAVDAAGPTTGSATASLTILSSLDVATAAIVNASKGNRSISVNTAVRAGGAPVSGATVSVTVRSPAGITVEGSGTTDTAGNAAVKFTVKPKDPSGTYQVQVVATKNGVKGTSSTSVVVQ